MSGPDNTDHVRMLCDISELNALFTQGISLDAFLQKIVDLVAAHLNAPVCSIYLYGERQHRLVLRATHGLHPSAVGKVNLAMGEGLVGTALKELRPICEAAGSHNDRYKFFPGIGEENYQAFLAVPVVRGTVRIGVLVVQRPERHPFDGADILALRATASQLATVVENVRFLLKSEAPGDEPASGDTEAADDIPQGLVKGKAASVGFALGPSCLFDDGERRRAILEERRFGRTCTEEEFERALALTGDQLKSMQVQAGGWMADSAALIFGAHLLMLADTSFTEAIRTLIKGGINPPEAVLEVYRDFRQRFAASSSTLIREKIQDLEDLVFRLLNNLLPETADKETRKGAVIIARDLFPSDLLKLSIAGVAGVVLVSGGVTSHIGILARSLRLPMVLADRPALLKIKDHTGILVDADMGNLYIDPSDEVKKTFAERNSARDSAGDEAAINAPAVTADGQTVHIKANVNLLSDVSHLGEDAVDGIGLYRSEFPFMVRPTFPSEEEQYVIYRKLARSMGEKQVTYRTLDIGGDKVLSYYPMHHEANPFLGMRSIRFSLTHQDLFRQQIRALLRAGDGHRIRIMFPMISSVDEFLEAKHIVEISRKKLAGLNIPHCPDPEIGLMLEIPSMIDFIPDLAGKADFISVGTNDLIQYLLAVDRTNEKVAHLYLPHHPAMLRAMRRIAAGCTEYGLPVTVCGDMANDPRYIPFLLGAGFRSLSVNTAFLYRVKKAIRETDLESASGQTEELLACTTIAQTTDLLFNGQE